jgi:hypothetical protein
MTTAIAAHALTALLLWTHPSPADVPRLRELTTIAEDIASTDADETEAEVLVAICIHESRCHLRAVGRDGSIGPWQVRGRCGSCPEIAASLIDPTLPRR